VQLFINGTVASSTTYTDDLAMDPSHTTVIGGQTSGRGCEGFINDVVLYAGAAKYDAAFTPPIEPITAIEWDPEENINDQPPAVEIDPFFASTVSLTHFDGVDGATTIADEIRGIDWTNLNVQIDIDQFKFNGASGLFSTNTGLSAPAGATWDLLGNGSAPWTVEAWIRPTSNTGIIAVFHQTTTISWTGGNLQMLVYLNPENRLEVQIRNGTATPISYNGGALNFGGVWQHIAVCSDGADVRGFIDGVQVFSGSVAAAAMSTSVPSLTIGHLLSAELHFRGHMDELRITKAARYTQSFTVPDRAFPDSQFE
jgi:hypothetical protein